MNLHLQSSTINGRTTMCLTFAEDQPAIALQGSAERRYALIDGLLWSALNSMLARFLKVCVVLPGRCEEHALRTGEKLRKYMSAEQFYMGTDTDARRIMRTVCKYLPELAPLTTGSADLTGRHADLLDLASLLQQRMNRIGEADYGINGILTESEAASA